MRKMNEVNLATVRFHPIRVQEFSVTRGSTEYSHDKLAVVDDETHEVLGIHGSGYSLLRHVDVLRAVVDVLETTRVTGSVHFGLNRTFYLYIYPDDSKYTVEIDDSKIRMGIRVVNSYDGTRAIKSELVAHDVTTGTGMYLRNVVSRSYHRHTKFSGDMKIFKAELKAMLNFNADEIKNLIEKSRSKMMDRDSVIEALRVPDKIKKEVIKRIPEGINTAWQMYRAIASVISVDEEKYSEPTLEILHKEANKVLNATVKDIKVTIKDAGDEEDE